MGTLYLDCYLIIFCNTNFFSIFLHPFLGFSCVYNSKENKFYFIFTPHKRPILFAEIRKKNNGQMIMDNGQLLETSLPLKKKNEKRKRE